MGHVLLNIYGPFAIHSFGLMLTIGLGVFMALAIRHSRRKQLMSAQTFSDITLIGVFAALIGGRLLAVLTNDDLSKATFLDIVNVWDGGLSLLGSVIGVLLGVGTYLSYKNIPVLPFFDLVAIHTPILQAIARLGCFFAGCCHGSGTNLPWGVMYHEQDSLAPLGIPLHPSQLYSASILALIFCLMYYLGKKTTYPGQLLGAYLVLISIERFITDFFRGDREFFSIHTLNFLSIHQWIGLGLAACGIALIFLPLRQTNNQRTCYEPV